MKNGVRKIKEPEQVVDAFTALMQKAGRYPNLTREDERNLAERRDQGDEEALNVFVVHNIRLLVRFAQRYKRHGLDFMDLIQEGTFGLREAAKRFDPERGYRFSTYAAWWIRHAMQRAIADTGRPIRIPVHAGDLQIHVKKAIDHLFILGNDNPTLDQIARQAGIEDTKRVEKSLSLPAVTSSLDEPVNYGVFKDMLADTDIQDTGLKLDREKMLEFLKDALGELEPHEQFIIKNRYGLNGFEEQTLHAIGVELNLSRERIRQLETQIKEQLRFILRRHLIGE